MYILLRYAVHGNRVLELSGLVQGEYLSSKVGSLLKTKLVISGWEALLGNSPSCQSGVKVPPL